MDPAGPVAERPAADVKPRRRIAAAVTALVVGGVLATSVLTTTADRKVPAEPRTRDVALERVADPGKPPGLVTVFYVSDRARFVPTAGWYVSRFTWPAIALGAGALLLLWVRRGGMARGRRIALGIFLGVGAAALVAMSAFDVFHMLQLTSRLDTLYGGDRYESLAADAAPYEMGSLQVSIPPGHERGEMERPSPWTGDFFEDPRRHLVVLDVRPLPEDGFYLRLREAVAGSEQEDAFVFVHGFNNGFEDAALRAAQIAFDLKFDGAPILYTWPSQGRATAYTVDETNARWAMPHLARFLADLRARSGAKRLHLVAHSMGNRILLEALERLRADAPGVRFDEVVLAAPDIDADTFRVDVPRLLPLATRLTLYASSEDVAISASKTVHGYRRAGDSTPSVVVVDGMDSIDVTAVTSSHSFIGDNGWVLDDLGTILLKGEPVHRRPGLRLLEELRYWMLEAVR